MVPALIGYNAKIDMSIQVNHISKDSCLVIANDSLKYSVCLPSGVKHNIKTKKRFSHVEDKVTKMHAIMLYFCLKPFLNDIAKLQICPDGSNTRQLNKYLLGFLLEDSEKDEYLRIKPKFNGVGDVHPSHKHAKMCRKLRQYDLVLDITTVGDFILEMQERSPIRG